MSFQANSSAAAPVPNGLPAAPSQYAYGRAVSPIGQAYCSPPFVNHANAYSRGGYNHQFVMANYQHSAVGSYPPVNPSEMHLPQHIVPGHNGLTTVGVQTVISVAGQNAVEPKVGCHSNNIESNSGCQNNAENNSGGQNNTDSNCGSQNNTENNSGSQNSTENNSVCKNNTENNAGCNTTASTVSRGSVDKNGVASGQLDNMINSNKTVTACAVETNVNDESSMNPIDIACSFVYQYYKMVHDNPKELHRFYDADSQMFRGSDSSILEEGSTAFGQKEIHSLLKKCFINGTTSRIRFIQAQECSNGINVLVTGKLRHGVDPAREFTQSVFLAKQKHPRKGWYVSNDMLTYLEFKDEEIIIGSKPDDETSKNTTTQVIQNDSKNDSCETRIQNDNANENDDVVNVTENKVLDVTENKVLEVAEKQCDDSEEKKVNEEKAETVQAEEEEKDIAGSLKVCESEKAETDETAMVEKKKKESYWKQNDVNADQKSSSTWPNLADSTNRVEGLSAEETVNYTVAEVENYAPTSYAGKLFKNLPNSSQPVKVGYAVPGPEANNNTAGRNDSLIQNPDKKFLYRKLWVGDLPQDMDDAAIKKAVADQLMTINNGYVIQVDRVKNKTFGYLELDCSDSVEILLERGLFFRGRTVRIDYVRNVSRSSGTARGGRLGMSSGYKREDGENRSSYEDWNGGGRRGGSFRKNVYGEEDIEEKGKEKESQRGKELWKVSENRFRHMNHMHNTAERREEDEEGWIDAKKKKQIKTNAAENVEKVNLVGKRITSRIRGNGGGGVAVGKRMF